MQLNISSIIIDQTIDIRDGMNEQTIQEYMDVLDQMPPVTVFDAEEGYILADGFHRVTAAERLGRKVIQAEIRLGARADAEEYAAYANATAGVKLTPEDRRVGIRRLHRLHPDWDKAKLAQMMGCGERVVASVLTAISVRTEAPSAKEFRETQVAEIAKTPREQWEPFARATKEKDWTNNEVRQARKNLEDPNLPDSHKKALLEGKTEPITHREDGAPAVLEQTIRRHLAQETERDYLSALEAAIHGIAQLRRFEAREVVDGLETTRLASLVRELPSNIKYLEDVLHLGRQKLEIWEVPNA